MPVCTSCTASIPYLYTIYKSAHNLRLEQCHTCQAFVDPYVEHDVLTLLIDLILLKPGVYRHLLYNRGVLPRQAGQELKEMRGGELKGRKARERVELVLKLGLVLVGIDAFIRFTHLSDVSSDRSSLDSDSSDMPKIFLACLAETIAFHAGVTAVCYVLLQLRDAVTTRNKIKRSSTRDQFHISMIPLTLLYSSLTKLFLLFLLSVWHFPIGNGTKKAPLTWFSELVIGERVSEASPVTSWLLHVLDDDVLDRKWVARNVLGGMSAGFGLRVVLDTHPSITTLAILTGWAVKTFVGKYMADWVGRGEEWVGWSIP